MQVIDATRIKELNCGFNSIGLSSQGSVLVAGSKFSDVSDLIHAGVVLVFTSNNKGTFRQAQVIEAPNAQTGMLFGSDVAISADETYLVALAVHRRNKMDNSPAAYVYVRDQTTGKYEFWQKIVCDYDGFPSSVSVSEDGALIAIGVHDAVEFGKRTGSVVIYPGKCKPADRNIRSYNTPPLQFIRPENSLANGSMMHFGKEVRLNAYGDKLSIKNRVFGSVDILEQDNAYTFDKESGYFEFQSRSRPYPDSSFNVHSNFDGSITAVCGRCEPSSVAMVNTIVIISSLD
jgi:hypothetical protein